MKEKLELSGYFVSSNHKLPVEIEILNYFFLTDTFLKLELFFTATRTIIFH